MDGVQIIASYSFHQWKEGSSVFGKACMCVCMSAGPELQASRSIRQAALRPLAPGKLMTYHMLLTTYRWVICHSFALLVSPTRRVSPDSVGMMMAGRNGGMSTNCRNGMVPDLV